MSAIKLRGGKLIVSFAIIIIMFGGLFWTLNKLGIFLQGEDITNIEKVEKGIDAGKVTLKALKQDKMRIDTDTAFLLTTENSVDEKIVKDNLKISPAFKYTLEKNAEGREYKIIPAKKLIENILYKFSFDTTGQDREQYNWAFQSKGSFGVLRTLPGNKSTNVPVNTGIEITFPYENVDISNIKDYFAIYPEVEGRFEMHKKTLVFLPKRLINSTLYTVTLKKGLPLKGNDEVLKEDYSFSFETAPVPSTTKEFSFDLDNRLTEFVSDEAPVFPAYFYRNKEVPALSISVYRYPDHKAFINSLADRDKIPHWSYAVLHNYKQDLRRLTKEAEYETNFLTVGSYMHYVAFPEPLKPGYYVAEIKAGKSTKQVWFQISDLAVYLAQSQDNAVLWVNDLKTKAPVKGLKAEIESKKLSFQGDNRGTALLNIKELDKKKDYILVTGNGKETIVPLEREQFVTDGWYKERRKQDCYWKYLYLDRELYKPGDVVHFWGVIAPRKGAVLNNQEITIELESSSYGSSSFLQKNIKLEDNTFTGEIKLPILKPGYYYFKIKLGDIQLLSRGFSVETYQKPTYQLSLKPARKVIFAGETTSLLAKASFFEGTSVPGLSLKFYANGEEKVVVTNEDGEANISYRGKTTGNSYSPFQFTYMGVNANLPEYGNISKETGIYVFQSKFYLAGDAVRQGDNFTLDVKLNRIDLSEIEKGKPLIKENYVKEAIGNTPIKGSVYQDIWKKIEVGERYDYICKQVRKEYRYEHSTKHIFDFNMLTDSDGKATYSGLLDKNNSYYIEIKAKDEAGRETKKTVYLRSYAKVDYQQYKNYHLRKLDKEKKGYNVGEEVKLLFMENEMEVPARENGFLFLNSQKNIETFTVENQPRYSFYFKQENIPNINVYGVYFDGNTYQEASSHLVTFDRETMGLKVEMKTDKKEYKPQDIVKLNVLVTDKDNKPVEAKVNLNLVDEALYSLQDQKVDFLNSLYTDYIYSYLTTYKSHFHPGYGDGAECGGEGDSERKDFQDTVLFTTLRTDQEGKASTEFQLPDNLTSWRVTYQALTPNLQAGSGTYLLPVRLPFFLEIGMNDVYLAGDSPIIMLRSYGERLPAASRVSYNMKLETPEGQEIVQKGEGVSFTSYDWQIPQLKAGNYTVTVEGKYGEYTDKVTKKFRVVKSFLERMVTDHELLREDLVLVGGKEEPTELIITDYERGQYLEGLYRLSWMGGSRLEQQLAEREAQILLKKYFPEEKAFTATGKEDDLLRYQRFDGGISILPYAESDVALTALVASSKTECFDRTAIKGYLYRILDNDKKDVLDKSLALWGLAALGEPVLNDINSQLREENLAPEVIINLALASLEIGNGAFAEEVYKEILSKYGEDLGATLRMKTGRDQDGIIKATGQMAVLAARLDQPEKNKLYQYLLENPGQKILNSLEQLQILKYGLRYMNSDPVSFTYELGGKKVTKLLKGNEVLRLTLMPEEIKNIKFSKIKGKASVLMSYSRPFMAEEIKERDELTITRNYTVDKQIVSTLSRSDLVQVKISYEIKNKAPQGVYEIIDVLPAGLRFVNRPYLRNREENWYLNYPTLVQGQKLTFSVRKSKGEITYYARVVSPGDFTAEPALLSNIKSNKISTLGNKNRIVIK